MKRALASCALLLLCFCSPDTAQRAHPRRIGAMPAPVLASQDRDFLEQAAEGSNAEIAIGALAAARAVRPEVKAFGQMMVRDHTAINRRLAAFAERRHIAPPADLGEHQAGYDRVVDFHRELFDEQFMQVMVEDHQRALQLFNAEASGGADPDLRAFAAATVPLIEAHLSEARSLAGPKPPPLP
jgi:putative membrane protein